MTQENKISGLRYRAGLTVLVLSFLSPLLIPLVAMSGISAGLKTLISGLLAVGIPELGILVAVAILGKPGYRQIREKIAGLMRKHGPPDTVSLVRYRIGLVMFVVPVIFAVVQPYGEYALAFGPIHETWIGARLQVAIAGDVLFLASFFVLGGDFWDKIRALFIHGAKALIPNGTPDQTP